MLLDYRICLVYLIFEEKMNKEQKNADWLDYFKLAVTQAKSARLSGEIERACHLDEIIEKYYQESLLKGYFEEDHLYEIENDIQAS